jgi:4-aminobutyrate aminotransferase-like enzyme
MRLAADSPVLGDARGAELYLGIDVVSPETGEPSGELASAIVNGMRERRVLISATGPGAASSRSGRRFPSARNTPTSS